MEQEQNRTEPATPFKLSEAKKRGQVAKSLDFNTMVIVWGSLLTLMIMGEGVWERAAAVCQELFAVAGRAQADAAFDLAMLGRSASSLIDLVLPFTLVGVICAALANVVQTGPVFSLHAVKPQFERLNPVNGFKRVFNKRMLFEALKSVLKLAFFGAITTAFFLALWPVLPRLEMFAPESSLAWLGYSGFGLLFRLALALLAVGLLDLLWVRWQYRQQMLMSRREMREEVKRREGDPLIRAKLRELQRENLKQARSMGRVGEADVLITNPEHVAVALRYVRGEMSAPHIIAKGRDAWAAEMRALARQHRVPIIERRPLARHLFRLGAIDQPIPSDMYVDVARVYADLGTHRRSTHASRSHVEVRT
jgi:flagellar biosynthesis protein FlhB